jgi:hypothetical protein
VCAKKMNPVYVFVCSHRIAPHSPSHPSLLAPLHRNSAKAVSTSSLPSLMHKRSQCIDLHRCPVVHSLSFAHYIIVSRSFALSPVDILRICDHVVSTSAPRWRYARVIRGRKQLGDGLEADQDADANASKIAQVCN